MGDQELKQCPFCDCGAMMFHPGGIAVYRVECPRCGVTTFTYDTREKAVAAWNRRTIPAAAAEQLKTKDEKIAELLANHAAINTVLDQLEPKIERTGEQSRDVITLLEAKDKRITELEEHERELLSDRRAYLMVETTDGLTASEWVMRAGLAKQAQEKAEADRDRWHQAVDDLTAHLVRVCTAAGISTDADEDGIVAAFAALKADLEKSYDLRASDETRYSKFNMNLYQELAELIGLPKPAENVSYGGGAIRSGIKELRERAAELEEQIDTRQALDELKAERDELRGQVAAMREKIEAYGRVPHWIADDALKFLEATAAGAPEAAVIKAVVLEYESCKRAGLNSCESEDDPGCAMWPICRHVDAMQKA